MLKTQGMQTQYKKDMPVSRSKCNASCYLISLLHEVQIYKALSKGIHLNINCINVCRTCEKQESVDTDGDPSLRITMTATTTNCYPFQARTNILHFKVMGSGWG